MDASNKYKSLQYNSHIVISVDIFLVKEAQVKKTRISFIVYLEAKVF